MAKKNEKPATKPAASSDAPKENAPKGKDGPTMTVAPIAMDLIRVVEGFNVRASVDGEGAREPFKKGSEKEPIVGIGSMGTSLDTLADDMKKRGLVQPVLVRPRTDGAGFDIVCGHRRLAAARKLGWTSIPAVIRDLSDKEAYLINMTENVQREDLSPGEIVERAIFMRERFPEDYAPGQDGASAALARDLNIAKSYMLNLIRFREKLIPEVWALIKNGRNTNAPPQHLCMKWCMIDDHDEQREAYHAWLGVKAKRDDEDGAPKGGKEGESAADPNAPPPVEYKRPGKDALEGVEQEIILRLRHKPPMISETEAKVALACIRYAIGKVGKDGQPPPAPYKPATSPTDTNTKGAKEKEKEKEKGRKGAN